MTRKIRAFHIIDGLLSIVPYHIQKSRKRAFFLIYLFI